MVKPILSRYLWISLSSLEAAKLLRLGLRGGCACRWTPTYPICLKEGYEKPIRPKVRDTGTLVVEAAGVYDLLIDAANES
jgi:hypothetical protein